MPASPATGQVTRSSSRRSVLTGLAAGAAVAAVGSSRAAAAPRIPLRFLAKDPPPATRVLRVPESYATVQAALDAALPGDHVSIRDGAYGGDLRWTRTGVGSGPHVVIKARNRHRAVFSGRLTVEGSRLWLHGIKTGFTSPEDTSSTDDYAIRIKASRFRMTRCLVDSVNGVRIYRSSPEYEDIVIAYNDFTGSARRRHRNCHIYVGSIPASSIGPTEVDIAYNRFDDGMPHEPFLPDGAPAPPDERLYIYLGDSKPGNNPTGVNLSFRVHHNALVGHRPRCIYLKRHAYVGFNYARTPEPTIFPQLALRHGGGPFKEGGIVEGNFLDGTGIAINDTGALVLGNRVPAGGAIRLHCGCGTWSGEDGRYVALYQAASGTVLAGNTGRYLVGYHRPDAVRLLLDSEGGRVANVRIHMAGRGTARNVRFEPDIPLATSDHTPGSPTEPYVRSSILIDPEGAGGYSYPVAVGKGLLDRVGANAP
jgi:hypothetical protein